MLRKLNFTERAKIARTNVRVTLRREADGVLAFDPQLSFDGVDLVPTARVFIEAYYRTSFMRFDCGSVEAFAPPADRRLTEIDGTSVVRFRVKVVDNSRNDHRIIAVADDLVVTEEQPAVSGRMPLLPVSFTAALEQLPWRIAHEPGPVLELNSAIDDIHDLAKHDATFFALVYPAAIREILIHILVVEGHDAHETGDEWWQLWLRWASRYSSSPLPSTDQDEARIWIDDVVAAFCAERQTVARWQTARKEES